MMENSVCNECAAEPVCYQDPDSCDKVTRKSRTNNPNGRPRMDESEKRKTVCLRLKPSTVEWLKRKSEELGISQAAVIDRLAE